MKVPSIEEVYAALDRMCKDGKMDEATRKYYEENGNHDVILTAGDMMFWDLYEEFYADEIEEDFFNAKKAHKH